MLPLPSAVQKPHRADLLLPSRPSVPSINPAKRHVVAIGVLISNVGRPEFGMARRRGAMVETVGMRKALAPQSRDHGVLTAAGEAPEQDLAAVALIDRQARTAVIVRR